MIASIEGNVTQILEDSIIIKVSGIGFKVFVSANVIQNVELHHVIALHTYLVVKEDSLTLYGFETLDERDMYIMLLSASGVGPRTALAILSTLSIDLVTNAVIQEQPEVFSRVSGVGKKTAQSIVLQLQGKVKKGSGSVLSTIKDVDGDVISALTSLGYSVVEAQTALQMIPKDAPDDIESRIRLALQYFS
jgi:holliday junction DNA helicase RuvA